VVPFVVAELDADCDPFMLHIYAALAEKARTLISEWTRVALAVKRPGSVAGQPDQSAGSSFAANPLPIIAQIDASVAISFHAIAVALNAHGVRCRGPAFIVAVAMARTRRGHGKATRPQ
jgi:hypothetical protein